MVNGSQNRAQVIRATVIFMAAGRAAARYAARARWLFLRYFLQMAPEFTRKKPYFSVTYEIDIMRFRR
jgi:hypothetical protein